MAALFVLALGHLRAPVRVPDAAADRHAASQATLLFSPDARRATATRRASTSACTRPRTLTVRSSATGCGSSSRSCGVAHGPRLLEHRLERTGDDGRGPFPTGTYAIKLRARSGSKQFNTTRNIVIDTTAPASASMTVDVGHARRRRPGRVPSGVHGGATRRRWCSRPCARTGARAVRRLGGGPSGRTAWCAGRGTAAGRRAAVAPGARTSCGASSRDAARNASLRERTCWVGYLAGRAIPRPPGAAPGRGRGAAHDGWRRPAARRRP